MVTITPLPKPQRVRRSRVTTTTIVPVQQTVTSRTLRNRRRRLRQKMNRGIVSNFNPMMVATNNKPYSSSDTKGVMTQFAAPPSSSLGIQATVPSMKYSIAEKAALSKISPDGIKFLKCAFAPPDFANADLKGVTDQYSGPSLIKKARYNGTWTTGHDRVDYILLLPTPGVAFWHLTKTAASPTVLYTDHFTPVFYSDIVQMFGPKVANVTDNVNQFRYISNHIELIPTINATQWAGSIQAFKLPISVVTRVNNTTGGVMTATGINGVNGTNTNMYTGPICNGFYGGTYSADSTFRFNPIFDNTWGIPDSIQAQDFCRLDELNMPNGNPMGVIGFDNGFESMLVKITNPSDTLLDSFIVKAYSCVEYKCSPGSTLVEYQSLSPPEDQVAIDLYKAIIKELPIGVHYLDNDTFWERVLNIITRVSGTLSVLPGPYGLAAGGVNSISRAMQQMFL